MCSGVRMPLWRTLAALVALPLLGCEPLGDAPDCFLSGEAAHVAASYEQFERATLSPSEQACVHDFRMLTAGAEEADDLCRREGTIACYLTHDRKRYDRLIVFSEPVWLSFSEDQRIAVARHELTHHLLRCIEGDPDPKHVTAAFDHSGQALGGPDSLVRYSFALEEAHFCNEGMFALGTTDDDVPPSVAAVTP